MCLSLSVCKNITSLFFQNMNGSHLCFLSHCIFKTLNSEGIYNDSGDFPHKWLKDVDRSNDNGSFICIFHSCVHRLARLM